jgi:hypothetical protein
MYQSFPLVQWPAMIKLHADDELIFISDAAQLVSDNAINLKHIQAQDMLIDSSGAIYRISHGQTLEVIYAGSKLSLHDVEALLRLHLSNNGNCCVSKFHASSIREAIISVLA